MEIEEIIEKAIVRFEKPLELNQLKQLFQYLTKNTRLDIYTTINEETKYSPMSDDPDDGFSEATSVSFHGKISGLEIPPNVERDMFLDPMPFVCDFKYEGNKALFKNITFDLMREYRIIAYRGEHILLWDKVRECVNTFFEKEYKVGK